MTFAITVGAHSATVVLNAVEDHLAATPPFAVGIVTVEGFDSAHAVLTFATDGCYVEPSDNLRGPAGVFAREEFLRRIDLQAGLVRAFAGALDVELLCRPIPNDSSGQAFTEPESPRPAIETFLAEYRPVEDQNPNRSWRRLLEDARRDPSLRSYLLSCGDFFRWQAARSKTGEQQAPPSDRGEDPS
jgi:hypothetical protein